MSLDKAKLWRDITSACDSAADCKSCNITLQGYVDYSPAIGDFLKTIAPSFSCAVSLAALPAVLRKTQEAFKEAEAGALIAANFPNLRYKFTDSYVITYGTVKFKFNLSDYWQANNPETEYLLKSCHACIKQDVPIRFSYKWNPETEEYKYSDGALDGDSELKNMSIELTFIRPD